MIITDMDQIEKSNLSRQFLFRAHHIKKAKSTVAAQQVPPPPPLPLAVILLHCTLGRSVTVTPSPVSGKHLRFGAFGVNWGVECGRGHRGQEGLQGEMRQERRDGTFKMPGGGGGSSQ